MNTGGSAVTVRTTDGKERRVPAASGVYWASAIYELRDELDRRGVPYRLEPAQCTPGGIFCPDAKLGGHGTIRWHGGELGAAPCRACRRSGCNLGWSFTTFCVVKTPRSLPPWARLGMAYPNRRHFPIPAARHASTRQVVLSGVTPDGRSVVVGPLSADAAKAPHGVVLGRHSMLVDCVVDSPEISRRHLRVRHKWSGFHVEDLNSSNGTLVNGSAIAPYRPTRLRDGDVLRCGNVEFNVSTTPEPEAAR